MVAPSDRQPCALFVQSGDYGAAYHALMAGEPETYRDQKASVEAVAGLAERMKVVVVCVQGRETPLHELAPNLSACVIPRQDLTPERISALFDDVLPSHLILRTPHNELLTEAGRRGLHVLPIFADIFPKGSLRTRWRAFKLRRALKKSGAQVFSNHTLNASRSMVAQLGCPAERVVPWDWGKVPSGGDPKTSVANPKAPRLLYAGAVRAEKGVGEVVAAVHHLRQQGIAATASIAGPGAMDSFQAQIDGHGLGDAVNMLGSLPNAEVRRLMRSHDVVIVPSWHSYPEGLPNTIYEGLASGSALVMSDHPAFRGRLTPDQDCLVFPQKDSAALAASIQRLCEDPALYARLSSNAPAAHDRLYVGLSWSEVISAFLDDPRNEQDWARKTSLKVLDA